jgi:thiol-disulfide isomerase/thioredoxin
MHRSIALAFAALGLILLSVSCGNSSPSLADGQWRAWLDSPGGELPFGLEFRVAGDELQAFLINGVERARVARVTRDGPRLTLSIDPYDAKIVATLAPDGRRLDGRWEKTGGRGTQTGLDFHAVPGELPRFTPIAAPPDPAALDQIEGRWAVRFETDDEPAVGIFETRADGTVLGTFLTTTGDYRYLAGHFGAGRLRLSCFDGAHAFLFDALLHDDATLSGDFWSRDSWHESWTARKDPRAELPDPFELTLWTSGRELGEIFFPDTTGRRFSLADPELGGRGRILEVFGSWCPNCNDATRFLVELDAKYRDRGLSIVGLAFEMTGQFERDAEQVRKYAAYHGVKYPLLIAGLYDKDEASRQFPLLDRIRSFPTTIFLHADGRVRAVHQGYAGPATGAANVKLRERFETLVQELLAEPAAQP